MLGWDPAVQRHDHEVVLQPGSTVLLYTDGLVERRGASLDRGMAWLAEAAAEMVRSAGEQAWAWRSCATGWSSWSGATWTTLWRWWRCGPTRGRATSG